MGGGQTYCASCVEPQGEEGKDGAVLPDRALARIALPELAVDSFGRVTFRQKNFGDASFR